jgi:putative membrane protein
VFADRLFAYLHLLASGLAAGLALAEYWAQSRAIDRRQARLLAALDLNYLLALATAAATGIARVMQHPGGPWFYLDNDLFRTKVAVFALLMAGALPASLQIARWHREARTVPSFAPLPREVARLRACLVLELTCFALLPLPSVFLAARGI